MSTTTLSAEVAPATRPALQDALGAAGGFALLGTCAGLGTGALAQVPGLAFTTLVVPLASWTVTGLSLLVVHQFLDLEATPEVVGEALVRGFVHTGRLAAGLSPVMLFFSVSSPSWFPLGCGLLGLTALCGLPTTARRLEAAEPRSSEAGFVRLVRAWLVFTTLVALRVGADLLG